MGRSAEGFDSTLRSFELVDSVLFGRLRVWTCIFIVVIGRQQNILFYRRQMLYNAGRDSGMKGFNLCICSRNRTHRCATCKMESDVEENILFYYRQMLYNVEGDRGTKG